MRLFNRLKNAAVFSAYIGKVFKTLGKIMQSLQYQRGQKIKVVFCVSFARGILRRLSSKWCSCSAPRRFQLPKVPCCLRHNLGNACIPRSVRACQMCSSQATKSLLQGLEAQPPQSLFFSSEAFSLIIMPLFLFLNRCLLSPYQVPSIVIGYWYTAMYKRKCCLHGTYVPLQEETFNKREIRKDTCYGRKQQGEGLDESTFPCDLWFPKKSHLLCNASW